MKKVITLVLCLLFLLQASAFAEVKKSISATQIYINSEYRLKIDGTNNFMWLLYSRMEYSATNNYLKDRTPFKTEQLNFSLFRDESAKAANSDITFSSKQPPYLVLFRNGIKIGQAFNITEIGTTELTFLITNKEMLANADNITFVITRKDGTIQEIDIPDDVVKEWKFIATCNLREEYKKGI